MRNTDIDNQHQKMLNFIHVANEKLTTLSADKYYNRYMSVCVCVGEGEGRFCIILCSCFCVRAIASVWVRIWSLRIYESSRMCVYLCLPLCVCHLGFAREHACLRVYLCV